MALGSNLKGAFASSEALLEAALDEFEAARLHIVARSSWWKSAAWPDPSGPEYRNGVAIVETKLGPGQVLDALREIERAFGRRRDEPNAARTLDLDLIAYGRERLATPDLILPHPRAAQRRFVLGPLAEVLPAWTHPETGQSVLRLLETAVVGQDAEPS